ncbi:MAG: XRE family transcriptional regulator, partial [Clostridia bacterium]|nr:XRE family transcriptional regulator [Clostridia bacterium]
MLDVTQLGEKIRRYRQKMSLTQTALAGKLRVSFQAISSWETGMTLPDIENLCRLSSIFGVSVDTLLQREASEGEEIMIAIDGGGTSAEFALFTSGGSLLTSFKLPGTNASVVGLETAHSIFRQGIDLCLAKTGQVSKVFIGNAGSELSQISKMLSKDYPGMVFHVTSDGVNALKSADCDAALICGTGSIMIREEGSDYRFVGGWGYLVGDPGSAYNIGRDAIREALAYGDGMHGEAMLYCMIREKYGLSLLQEYDQKPVAFIASIAPLVFEAYDKGDSVA